MPLSLETSKDAALCVQQHDATWQDYVALRDDNTIDWQKIAFNQGWLWADMGTEGPNHASFSDLMTIIFGFWAFLNPNVTLQSYGQCLIEKPATQACVPNLVLYKGDNIPKWRPGEPRRISTTRHRLPDLVGEIGDTTLSLDLDEPTLSLDLDEQKQLYASLGIPEYWVIDVKGMRLFAGGGPKKLDNIAGLLSSVVRPHIRSYSPLLHSSFDDKLYQVSDSLKLDDIFHYYTS